MRTTFLLILLLYVLNSQGATTLVLKTVGQVADQVITSRTVQINAGLEQALYQRKGQVQIPKMNSMAFKKEVSATLLETTVFMESKNFNLAQVKNSDVSKAYTDALRRLSRVPDWKALEVEASEIRRAIQRKLRAKKFIRFKADSSVVPVTNSEARDYFDKNRLKFGDLPFENFKENIKAYLSRQQVEQRLRDWFEVLQNKYNVKNALSEI